MSLSLPPRFVHRLLILTVAFSSVYQIGQSVAAFELLKTGHFSARAPMEFGFRLETVSGVNPEAQKAGVRIGDKLLAINGRPFTGEMVMFTALGKLHADDAFPFTLARPDGTVYTTSIRLAAYRPRPAGPTAWVVTLAVQVFLPFFCLFLGYWVAAARPYDRLAWLLLALMIGFSQLVTGFSWSWPLMPVAVVWNSLLGSPFGIWLVWLVLFAIYFPERAALDRKRPWLKWIVLTPLIVQTALFAVVEIGSDYRYSSLYPLRPLLNLLLAVPLYTILAFVAILVFFSVIWMQSVSAQTPDSRRRIRILYFGTIASLIPLIVAAVISVFQHSDIFRGLPQWAVITSLLFLILFPLTMAYVIVVQRAMAVSMVIRQGVKYALARNGFLILKLILLSGAITWAVVTFQNESSSTANRVLSIAFLLAIAIARRKLSDRFSSWIDKRFFREAYSADLVMSELAQEARRFTEVEPLLSTVATRVSHTLHVSRMAVFVRENGSFRVAEAIGFDAESLFNLSPESRSARLLTEAKRPEVVYFDDPRNWVHAAPLDEQEQLRALNAEVLLALPGRSELLGMIALGPKRSEQPYSPSDLRLLQSVAVQTGFALENTNLIAQVAREAGQRERLNREMEIAREVQQRLFPQTCPPVPGIDYYGTCRPALAVGGDYYDYIARTDGRLGIALGDVSGKGISAALMMASLQSLMRGQIEAGLDDLAVLITNTNRLIFDVSTSNRYATFFYGEYHPQTRRLVYVNAGHNPPIVLRGDEVIRLEACGPVVGLLRGIQFSSAEFLFESGDLFVTFTDGISEAMTADDEEWGDDRLIAAAQSARDLPAQALTRAIMEAADTFTAGAEQHDDMTLIALKIH